MLMSGSKKLSEKAKGKQKAKAAALPLGRALLSASLPLSSKKREHQLTVPELSTAAGPSGMGVSERQIRRDTAAMQEFAFKQTADNPARMAAAIAGLMRYPAMQPHLPTEYTQQYTEEQQAAMLVGDEEVLKRKARGVWKGANPGGCLWCLLRWEWRGDEQILLAGGSLSSEQAEQSRRVQGSEAGPGLGLQHKGDNELNICWLERVDEQNRSRVFDPHGAEQTVPLKTTLPRKVPEWERTSTSRRVLTANDEDEYIEMCRAILEEKPTYSLLRHLQQKRMQGGASKAPAAAATAGPAVAAGPGVAAVRAHRHFTAPLPSPPAQGVRRGACRAARRAGPGKNRQ